MISIIARRANSALLWKRSFAAFSGGHHAKPFDWRDDHDLNPNFQRDPRRVGCRDPYTFEYPHHAEPQPWTNPFLEAKYNPKDLTMNYLGVNKPVDIPGTNPMELPHQNLMEDVAHEFDYESQDLDFQPESFKSQHFKKRGLTWMWWIIGLTPFWLVISEVAYQQMVNGDGLKYQRPPPLNYPDEEDTPDTETYECFQSIEYKHLHDAGIVKDPFFEIKDGKKIYSKWAGVNDPHPLIYF